MADELRDLLRAQVDRELRGAPREDVRDAIKRGSKRRAIARIITGVGLTAVVLIGALAAPELVGFVTDRSSGSVSIAPSTPSDTCPRSRGKAEDIRWTSPTLRVAHGEFDGEKWVLCARTVESKTSGRDGLCMNWQLGKGLSSGMNCGFMVDKDGQPVALDADYFSPVMGPQEGYLFGAAPEESSAVTLEKPDGNSVAGELYDAPEKLHVPFTFFTLFDEPYTEGRLVLRDGSGVILVQREMKHGLSELSVVVNGEGRGSVRGYRTAELRYYEDCRRESGAKCRRPRQTWIDCPDECVASLAGAEITLVARPKSESTFLGWSGACSGRDRCELVVSEPTRVEATFE